MRRSTRALALVTGVLIAAAISWFFLDDFLDWLIDFLEQFDSDDPGDATLFFFAIWISILPFMPGYSFVIMGCGFVFGWFPGLPLAYIGRYELCVLLASICLIHFDFQLACFIFICLLLTNSVAPTLFCIFSIYLYIFCFLYLLMYIYMLQYDWCMVCVYNHSQIGDLAEN
jgi:hypothetical protein